MGHVSTGDWSRSFARGGVDGWMEGTVGLGGALLAAPLFWCRRLDGHRSPTRLSAV